MYPAQCTRCFFKDNYRHYWRGNLYRNFELTESIFFDNDKFKAVKKSLDEMHYQGFLCSLDDFGVGYSSLGLLKEFDIDTIKFDRQFFLDVSTKKSKTIVESLMDMSGKLGIKTVAEGIETHHQLSYLNETTCNIIQGYIFSMPLAVPEFEKWLDTLKDGKPDIKQMNF
ncbi:MAG: EAL domain-containing protein [Spirochaetaceae bacterium]|nr:EAL domain-containing protein [Spirochaetaceae bacterium]